MTKIAWRSWLGTTVLLVYPLLIFLGLKVLEVRWLALLMLVLAGIRLSASAMPVRTGLALTIALLISLGFSLLTGSARSLLFYPVLVNLVMLALFLFSWFYPPTMIELIARIREAELPDAALAYMRKVTLVWVFFFIINGSLAAYTTTLSREAWVLYNGLISYLLMGLLFAGEWLVRQNVKQRHHV